MTDDANLHGTLDASVWAAEFCKRWPSALCQIAGKEGVSDGPDFEATMIGWFANAIMTGYDKALAASPEVQALIAEAVAAEQVRCADVDLIHEAICNAHDMDATFSDYARSVAAAIRRAEGETT